MCKKILYIAFVIFTLLSLSFAETISNIKIEPIDKYQSIIGFGHGNMEQQTPIWYHKYPAEELERICDKLHTTKGDGLALNIYRYPMPTGDAPEHNHMTRLNKYANKPFEYEEGKWNWQGHEDVMWLGLGAAKRGAMMWASWYGYPYWMTNSGCSAGSLDGKSNNLKTEYEAKFIEHCITVMQHFTDNHNIKWDYVAPINEPDCDWWKSGGGQPGAHTSSTQAIRLYAELAKALSQTKMNPQLIAYDAAYANSADYLYDMLKSPVGKMLRAISCHQYITSNEAMTKWAETAKKYDKELWMSEWGDWTNAGNKPQMQELQMMNYANKLHEAFKILHAQAWVMWEAGFLFDKDDAGLKPRKAYWAVAQYSRHLPPQTRQIGCYETPETTKTTAWISIDKDSHKKKLILITVNDKKENILANYDLTKFKDSVVSLARRTSNNENYAEIMPQIENRNLKINMPGNSIVTTEITF